MNQSKSELMVQTSENSKFVSPTKQSISTSSDWIPNRRDKFGWTLFHWFGSWDSLCSLPPLCDIHMVWIQQNVAQVVVLNKKNNKKPTLHKKWRGKKSRCIVIFLTKLNKYSLVTWFLSMISWSCGLVCPQLQIKKQKALRQTLKSTNKTCRHGSEYVVI